MGVHRILMDSTRVSTIPCGASCFSFRTGAVGVSALIALHTARDGRVCVYIALGCVVTDDGSVICKVCR